MNKNQATPEQIKFLKALVAGPVCVTVMNGIVHEAFDGYTCKVGDECAERDWVDLYKFTNNVYKAFTITGSGILVIDEQRRRWSR